MPNNNYSWNQTLKFSWGHIIAFLALIFISYIAFMGEYYLSGGNFSCSVLRVFIIDVFLLATFIGAQILKGKDEKFARSIVIERILIFLCPFAFLFAMVSYNHFWTVFSEREQIEANFNKSIVGAKQMFTDYDEYSKKRISSYTETLYQIIFNKYKYRNIYNLSEFNSSNEQTKVESYVLTLKLQLQSQNTDSLRTVALEWIGDANQGASVWNAFLIGNIEQIKRAIDNWHATLKEYSKPVLSNETATGNTVMPFDENGKSIEASTTGLNSLKDIYSKSNGVEMNTVITGIILFLMLLFPYLLQKRNTRAEGLYFLIPRMKAKSNLKHHNSTRHVFKNQNPNDIVEDDEDDVITPTPKNDSRIERDKDDLFSGTF